MNVAMPALPAKAPTTTPKHLASRPPLRTPAEIWFSVIFALPSLFYALGFTALRELDAPGLVAVALSAIVSMFIYRCYGRFAPLLPFFAFSLAVLVLSMIGWMPHSWAKFISGYVAIRQWGWLPTLTLATGALYILIRESWPLLRRYSLVFAVVFYALSRLSRYWDFGHLAVTEDLLLYTITNDNAPVYGCLAIYVLYGAKSQIRSVIAGILLILASSSQSSQVASLLVLAMLLTKLRKSVLVTATVGMLAFLVVAPQYTVDLYRIDANTGFRAVLWRDAQQALKQTAGLGVGYGTPYFRNDFRNSGAGYDQFHENDAALPFIGTHSSFYDVSLRVGLPGLLIFVWGIFALLRGFGQGRREARLFYGTIGVLIANNMVNMGLASINFTLGSGLFLALAMHARDLSRARARAMALARIANDGPSARGRPGVSPPPKRAANKVVSF